MKQGDAIEYLGEWIRNKTNLGTDSRPACQAVVVFFIRNCEVFSQMKFSSKVTPYKKSIIAKFPAVLSKLGKQDMTSAELYKGMRSGGLDIREFMDIMDCLDALNKIELKERWFIILVEAQ